MITPDSDMTDPININLEEVDQREAKFEHESSEAGIMAAELLEQLDRQYNVCNYYVASITELLRTMRDLPEGAAAMTLQSTDDWKKTQANARRIAAAAIGLRRATQLYMDAMDQDM